MQVRARRASRLADSTDDLATGDVVSGLHIDAREMRVQCVDVRAVGKHYGEAIIAPWTGPLDPAVLHGPDRRASDRGDVHTLVDVRAPAAQAEAVRRGHYAIDRPARHRAGCRRDQRGYSQQRTSQS